MKKLIFIMVALIFSSNLLAEKCYFSGVASCGHYSGQGNIEFIFRGTAHAISCSKLNIADLPVKLAADSYLNAEYSNAISDLCYASVIALSNRIVLDKKKVMPNKYFSKSIKNCKKRSYVKECVRAGSFHANDWYDL